MIIVSPRQISDDTAKTGVVKLIRHTRIRRDYRINVNRSKTAGLDAFLRHCVKNRPRQASLSCIVDFETAVCFLKRVLLFIIKSAQKKIISCALEFLPR